jgi:hypothetical protein
MKFRSNGKGDSDGRTGHNPVHERSHGKVVIVHHGSCRSGGKGTGRKNQGDQKNIGRIPDGERSSAVSVMVNGKFIAKKENVKFEALKIAILNDY